MYRNLEECITDLEKNGHLIRIKEEVDPHLEMAAIHLRMHELKGPALLFERVKGSRFRAASNLFGTIERSRFIFRDTWDQVQTLIALRNDPMKALKKPFRHIGTAFAALKALPLKQSFPAGNFEEISISELPLIQHWPMDGGAFVTLPQVYTEDPEQPGIMQANLGMYRIQLTGNEYVTYKEVGLHYQIHRGIGIHQTKANQRGIPLKVSCFVGGHPAHTLAAVMPLPEGLSELTFAGMLAGRRFRYSYQNGFAISNDADFIITGEVFPGENKPEGPFGDHLGYYSLTHPFPLMKIHKVYARKRAIWNFTVVGRPPQEDTAFGALIHELTGDAIRQEIPGVQEVHAVDAAGVHPLLFAIGSERYTPYLEQLQPAELLTQANRILGTGQLSLAKFLFITAHLPGENKFLNTYDTTAYLSYILERIDLRRDVHFQTNTTIDTLDYSGTGLNSGSKVVFAAYGPARRSLAAEVPTVLTAVATVRDMQLVMPGVLAVQAQPFTGYQQVQEEIAALSSAIEAAASPDVLQQIPLIVLCDDARFLAKNINNFLWTTFTRSNPSHDIYGVGSFTRYKHWGCEGPLIIDARSKPHHAPALVPDPVVANNIQRLFKKGGSLQAWDR
jgi:4-hydroxy-3-polyprenylbenzoate decarboxylase